MGEDGVGGICSAAVGMIGTGSLITCWRRGLSGVWFGEGSPESLERFGGARGWCSRGAWTRFFSGFESRWIS